MLPLALFGFGGPMDMAIVAGVVVLLFGGSKIASWGKNLGEGMKEFKKATQDVQGDNGVPDVSAATPAAVRAGDTPHVTDGTVHTAEATRVAPVVNAGDSRS